MKTSKKLLSVVLTILTLTVFMAFSVNAVSAPKAPATVTATSTKNSITLNWTKVKGATGYRVYYKTGNQTSWTKCLSSTKKLTYTLSDLSAGKVYTFAVRSYIKAEDKSVTWGKYTTVQTATKPVATSKITPTPGMYQVKLSWEAVKGATHYKIYQKVDGKWKSLGYTTKLEKTITKLYAIKKYEFAVRSYIKLADGSLIAGSYKTIETAVKRFAPENVQIVESITTLTVSWYGADINEVISGYRVYYKAEGEKSYQKTPKTTKTKVTLTNLSPDTTYKVIVKSYIKTASGDVWSLYDVETAKTYKGTPGADDNVAAVTDGGLKLYTITSTEAKEIKSEWGVRVYTYYETKNANNTTLIYFNSDSGWTGIDINGAMYDDTGNIIICHFCGLTIGAAKEHCDGGCNKTFS